MDGLSFDSGLMVWTWITFAALFLLLARFTFKPLHRLMDQRERSIRDAIEQAQQVRKEAEALLKEHSLQVQNAQDEARQVIAESHRIVAQMKREAHDQAKREAEYAMQQARTDIDREVQRSLDDLKKTVAALSLRIARQVIKANLDENEHEKLAGEFVDRLKKTNVTKRS